MIQVALSALDLVGLALLGLVVLMAASIASDGSTTTGSTWSWATDRFAGTGDPLTATLILAATAAVVLVLKSLLSYLLTRRTFRFLANRQAAISGRLAASLLAQPLLFVQRRSSQQTAGALTRSVSMITLGILGQAVILVAEGALLVVLLVALFFVDLWVTVFALVIFGLVGLATQALLSTWARSLGSRSFGADMESYTAVQEALKSYREMTVAGRRSSYVERFADLRRQAAVVQVNLFMVNLLPKYIYEIAFVVGGSLLAASQLLTKDAATAIAVLAIFLAAGSRMMPSVLRMQAAAITMRTAIGEGQAALDLNRDLTAVGRPIPTGSVDYGVLAESARAGHPGFEPRVEVRNCTLWYPGADRPSLGNVSLTVNPGTSAAIVGSTGAGKSTLADVILGVLQPNEGAVTIGGCSPSAAVAQWPGAIAYVPQDVALINGTVRENVGLGLPAGAIDDQLVWEALERAHLSTMLTQDRDGLDTVVGEHGVRLSGGQRQRLGLARALYTRPSLLVLDEATSALDAETELVISEALRALTDASQLIIAHRLATVRECSVVYYLQKGSLIASGSFEELVERVPAFANQARILGLATD